MKTTKTSQIENLTSKLQLVDGEFTPSQAQDIISSLIKQKINYHKIKNLQNWEKNHQFNEEPARNRIKELEENLKIANDLIMHIKEQGQNVKIDGIINITGI